VKHHKRERGEIVRQLCQSIQTMPSRGEKKVKTQTVYLSKIGNRNRGKFQSRKDEHDIGSVRSSVPVR